MGKPVESYSAPAPDKQPDGARSGLGVERRLRESALHIAVLGPMEVCFGDAGNRAPTAAMARRTLAVLLLHANRVVPLSLLIDELWDEAPPRLARKTVQTYVYQLRQAFGHLSPEVIETRGNGYMLPLAPGELDLWDFEQGLSRGSAALEEGDAERAAAVLREALDLWRGSAFADISPGPMLAARIAQIDEARLYALELRIESDLRLGRHRGLLGELAELTAIHPLHEEFTAQLMLAAQRSGQRGTALDAFTRLRSRLIDELGLEPSRRLSRLQQQVLSQ